MRRSSALSAWLLAACPAPPGASMSTSTTQSVDPTTTGAAGSSGGAASSSGGASDGSTSSPGTSEATGDPGTAGDATTDATTSGDPSTSGTTGEEPKTCKKVDILFVIVDGGELWDTGGALEDLMPHLAQRLETDFAGWDYHLMVTKADASWGNKGCDELCEKGQLCETIPPYPCDYDPDACDLTLGAGITFPAGAGASNVPCPIEGDQRYVVSGQHDLAGTLDCLQRVGTGYSWEDKYTIVRATLDALSDPLNAAGACNDGFLREDAYLILFLVTPFPDFYSEGTPEAWTKELKAHKGGKFDKIYFIGLFQGCMSGFGWWEYEPLNEWVTSLYHHALDDACADELISSMDPALDYVLDDCEE